LVRSSAWHAIARYGLDFAGDDREGFFPACRPQPTVFAQVRLVEPLGAQSVDHMASFVGNPFLVHVIVSARQDAHHFAPARINADRRTQRVHDVD